MNADGFAFDEHRLERLDGQTVQRRRAVEQDGVAFGHLFQHVPHFGRLPLNHLLGRAHGVHIAQFFEAADNERLEQHERHLLRQPALIELEFGADDDDGTARVIHAFAQQVLAETSVLALEHVAQRFQRAIASASDSAAMAAVVQQRIHRFLQHAFFVADDDFRRFELEQVFQPVIAVDHAAIQIVQVGGGETAAFQRHQGAQVGRDDRQHRLDHPFRTRLGGEEPLEQLDALGELFADLLALGLSHRDLQLVDLFRQFDFAQGFAHGFGTHLGDKGVRSVGFDRFFPVVFAQQLMLLERGRTGIDHHVIFVVNNALEIASRHVQDQTDAGRHALEEPNVRDRHGQFDMPHAFATNAGKRHFHTATIAHHPAVFDPLILAARTFPILHRPENALTE